MAYEKDLYEIILINKLVEELRERILNFTYEIETNDTEKALKQVKTLNNTTNRIIDHLSSLTTTKDFENFIEEEKEKTRVLRAIDKVRNALKNNAMIDSVSLKLHNITKEDMDRVCKYYGIEFYTGSHGNWTWLQFKKDEKMLSSDDLREIGLLEKRDIVKKVIQEAKAKEKETNEIEPLNFGWVSPLGVFTEGDFGDHEEKAIEIIEKENFKEEYKKWRKDNVGLLARDFLVKVKGYVLLHNPYMGGLGKTIASYEKKLTKKQCEFLYDYYLRDGEEGQAKYYLDMYN